jgi:hypothetical protein
MSGDEITPTDAAIELSDEELDEVAGGLSLRLNAVFFRQTNVAAAQQTQAGSGYSSTKSVFEMQNIESAGLQLTVLDASAEDLEFLSGILGGAKAIDG